MVSVAIYPGTFDPITNGHIDIIERASKLFDNVVVAIAADTPKRALFALEERVHLAKQCLSALPLVKVQGFQGLFMKFAQTHAGAVVIRGIRALADFEYERQLVGMTQQLAPSLEHLFMLPTERYSHISSTFVREIARLGGDIAGFVPPPVAKALKAQFL